MSNIMFVSSLLINNKAGNTPGWYATRSTTNETNY